MEIEKFYFKNKQFLVTEKYPPLSTKDINKLILDLKVKLPKSYLEILSFADKLRIKDNCILYKSDSMDDYEVSAIYFISCKNIDSDESDVVDLHNNPPEFFPEGLIAFGEDGGGNYICFDYRTSNDDPKIVIWEHDAEQGNDISFVADNFEEFILNLISYEESEKKLESFRDAG